MRSNKNLWKQTFLEEPAFSGKYRVRLQNMDCLIDPLVESVGEYELGKGWIVKGVKKSRVHSWAFLDIR